MSDFGDLDRLAADLTKAGPLAGLRAVKVMRQTGKELQDEARNLAPKGPHLPAYAATITWELEVGPAGIMVEVGPEKGGQGSLGHLLENGTPTSAPQAHLGPALDRVGPDFVKRIAEIGGDIL